MNDIGIPLPQMTATEEVEQQLLQKEKELFR